MAPAETAAPLGAFAVIFVAAFALSLAITPLAIHLGRRWGLVAKPGGRRQHTGEVPRTGSIPIFVAFFGAVLLSRLLVINPSAAHPALPETFIVLRFDPKEVIRLTGLLVGGTFIFIAGLLDDWWELSPLPQYFAQLLASAIAVAFLIIIEYVNNPFTGSQTPDFPYLLTATISLFWLGLMINTVNWLDGLDGLASGVVAIACVVLFVNAVFRLNPPQHSVALLPIALLGATLGFLPYNFYPAKIFLGSGAVFLGYVLGILSIIGGAKMASILLVMGLPLLDVAWQVVNRVLRGQNPVLGDRGHLHFRLADLGLSQNQIVLGYYVFCALFGALALLIPSRLYKFVAILVMGLLSLAGFIWLTRQQAASTDTPAPDSTDG